MLGEVPAGSLWLLNEYSRSRLTSFTGPPPFAPRAVWLDRPTDCRPSWPRAAPLVRRLFGRVTPLDGLHTECLRNTMGRLLRWPLNSQRALPWRRQFFWFPAA